MPTLGYSFRGLTDYLTVTNIILYNISVLLYKIPNFILANIAMGHYNHRPWENTCSMYFN